jgi:hypothetical protein
VAPFFLFAKAGTGRDIVFRSGPPARAGAAQSPTHRRWVPLF